MRRDDPYWSLVLPNGETTSAAFARLTKKQNLGPELSALEKRIWAAEKEARGGEQPNWIDCKLKALTLMAIDRVDDYKPPEPELPRVVQAKAEPDFLVKCREGLRMKLPDRASIDKELAWVSANIHRDVPEIKNAPSYTAINLLIDVWTDDKVRATFWSTCLSKRLTPGDTKAKKEVVLKEDRLDDDSEDFADDLERRLAGQ